jgi:SAM-dependent methyltransferase
MNANPSDYYEYVNSELLRQLPGDARLVVEIGCGAAALAREYRRVNPGCRYVGIERVPEAAAVAAGRLSEVIVADVERLADADVPFTPGTVDVLVYGDVLEHLVDPWTLLRRQAAWLAPEGVVLACIPNVAHWTILVNLLMGQWPYEEAGLLDRTHLRFFTLESIQQMFAEAGLKILGLRQTSNTTPETASRVRQFVHLALPLAKHLGAAPEPFTAQVQAYQYIVRAVKASL